MSIDRSLLNQLRQQHLSTPLYILGLSGKFCDSGAALYRISQANQTKLIAAIEEERVYKDSQGSREKHHPDIIPRTAITKLLELAKINYGEISCIAVSLDRNLFVSTKNKPSVMATWLTQVNQQYHLDQETLSIWGERLATRLIPQTLEQELRQIWQSHRANLPPIAYVNHHYSHALSAAYLSGFSGDTLVFTSDAIGEKTAAGVYLAKFHPTVSTRVLSEIDAPNSLGHYYAAMTEYLGFKPLSQEGEVMGLAPYGKPTNLEEKALVGDMSQVLHRVVQIEVGGGFRVDPTYLYYGVHTHGSRYTDKFWQEMSPFCIGHSNLSAINAEIDTNNPTKKQQLLAFAVQTHFEDIILRWVKKYLLLYPQAKYLALAGGTFLNSVVNGKLIQKYLVEQKLIQDIYVQPSSTDAGGSLGAALAVIEKLGFNPLVPMRHAYWGKDYTQAEISTWIAQLPAKKYRVKLMKTEAALIDWTVSALAHDEPVAWFQGKMEWGPRALGNRSLLLGITDPFGNRKANRLKGRQGWRPSACSILDECMDEYLSPGYFNASSPFMITVCPVQEAFLGKIRSGLHEADLSARPQSVSKKSNPLYWRLLHALKLKTGIGAVLNTSFNRRGQPLVESPIDALQDFAEMPGIQNLVIGPYVVSKRTLTRDWKCTKFGIEVVENKTETLLNDNAGYERYFPLLTKAEKDLLREELLAHRQYPWSQTALTTLEIVEKESAESIYEKIGQVYFPQGDFPPAELEEHVITALAESRTDDLLLFVSRAERYLHPGLVRSNRPDIPAADYVRYLLRSAIALRGEYSKILQRLSKDNSPQIKNELFKILWQIMARSQPRIKRQIIHKLRPYFQAQHSAVIISGIAGQDGFYLTNQLTDLGIHVYGMDICSYDLSGSSPPNPLRHFVRGDICRLHEVQKLFDQITAANHTLIGIINLAAISNPAQARLEPERTFQISVTGSMNLYSEYRRYLAKVSQTGTFIQPLSALLFRADNEPFNERSAINLETSDIYLQSKLSLWLELNKAQDNRVSVIKWFPTNHESGRRETSFFVGNVIQSALNIRRGRQTKIKLGSYQMTREYGDANNFMSVYVLSLIVGVADTFVLGTGQTTYNLDLIKLIFRQTGLTWDSNQYYESNPEYASDPQTIADSYRVTDISKLKYKYGFTPEHDLTKMVKSWVAEAALIDH